MLRPARKVRWTNEPSTTDLRGGEKPRAPPRAPRRHGAIHILPYDGRQSPARLATVPAGASTVAGGFPVVDQALVVAHEFTFGYPCHS